MSQRRALSMQDLEPLEALMPAEFPEVWRSIATSVYTCLMHETEADRCNLVDAQDMASAAKLAITLTIALATDIGGDTVYMPVGHFMRAGETARKVIAAFRGNNHYQVAKLAGVTVSRVRQILREYQRAEFELRQGRLSLE